VTTGFGDAAAGVIAALPGFLVAPHVISILVALEDKRPMTQLEPVAVV
jgi:hypothetical protein